MKTTDMQKESKRIYSKVTQLAYPKSIQFDDVKTYEVTTRLEYKFSKIGNAGRRCKEPVFFGLIQKVNR
ncbi:MAG TPA: hypothetical protein VFD46_04985 [Chryseolinea sp.]|jgi:hypothetical protein|nr:hypothetical protein [Chryseolinea sp.]